MLLLFHNIIGYKIHFRNDVITCDPRALIPVRSKSCYVNFFSYQIQYEKSLKSVFGVNRRCNPTVANNTVKTTLISDKWLMYNLTELYCNSTGCNDFSTSPIKYNSSSIHNLYILLFFPVFLTSNY